MNASTKARPHWALLAGLGAWLCLKAMPVAALCAAEQVDLLVLGSGGPELADGRAATGYVVSVAGRARVLIDAGAGTAVHFQRLGLAFEDLDAVLLTHLHVDHVADLPSFIKASFFGTRTKPLPILGPQGNAIVPATSAFVASLFSTPGQSSFGYLSGFMTGTEGAPYALVPRDIAADGSPEALTVAPDLSLEAMVTDHGPIPALAWRIDIGDCRMAFSGDTAASDEALVELAQAADLFIAHHAIPEAATGVARHLHMPPSRIGEIAALAGVKRLLLSHRMRRTLGLEAASLGQIRQHYPGPVEFAEDLQRY